MVGHTQDYTYTKEGQSDHPVNIPPPPPIKIAQIFKPVLGFPQE